MLNHIPLRIRTLQHVGEMQCIELPVHPIFLFVSYLKQNSNRLSCHEAALSLGFTFYKPSSLHAAGVFLLMYARGSFVSNYTPHGFFTKIFLHYYGDLVF